jgi:hypothetical protein
MKQYIDAQPTRDSAAKVRQGGTTRVTLWILIASVALAAIVGLMLLTNTDEFPPSQQRNPIESAPVSGSQPAPAPTSPQTRQ